MMTSGILLKFRTLLLLCLKPSACNGRDRLNMKIANAERRDVPEKFRKGITIEKESKLPWIHTRT